MMSSPSPSSPTRHLASLVAVHLGTVGHRGRLSCSQRKRDTYKTSLPKLISHTNTVCVHCRETIDDFHRIRHLTAPHRHALYAWVPPSPRVRCRKAFVTYLLTYCRETESAAPPE